jgi:hypothetical protein
MRKRALSCLLSFLEIKCPSYAASLLIHTLEGRGNRFRATREFEGRLWVNDAAKNFK